MNRLKRENDRVNEELKEVVSHGNKGENQLNQLKKSKKDLEAKMDELNEELDDQAGQIQQLEQVIFNKIEPSNSHSVNGTKCFVVILSVTITIVKKIIV